MIPYKIYLDERELPDKWLNIKGFMKDKPAPLIRPTDGKPCTLGDLTPVFCDALAAQVRLGVRARHARGDIL